jgi:hypothetical protein
MGGLSVEPRQIRLPCYFTKPHAPNRDFFSRPEPLSLIKSTLIPSDTGAEVLQESLKTFVLCGMGGLGKTEIAIEFVFAHLNDFDAVFIFHAGQTSTLAEEYAQAAIKLGVQKNKMADPQDSRELFKDWLADPVKPHSTGSSADQQYAKWLILFDNADDPELLSDYWPTSGVGSVLVTSRNPMAKSTFFFGDVGHELQTVPISDAVKWILQMSDANASDQKEVDAANIIAERLGGLPLAITQIMGIIRMRQLRLPEFVELYESESQLEELQTTRVGNPRGYEHSLASVWAFENLKPEPMALLGIISMLDPDRIQEEILKASTDNLHSLPYPTKPLEYHRTLTPLLQSSLIYRNSVDAELRVHRLVADVVRKRLQQTEALINVFNLTVDLVSAVWPFWRIRGVQASTSHNVSRWDLSGKLYPHVYKLVKTFSLIREQFESLESFGKFADLIHEAAWYVIFGSRIYVPCTDRCRYQFERSNFKATDLMLDLAEEIYKDIKPEKYDEMSIISDARSTALHWQNQGEKSLIHAERRAYLQKLQFQRSGKETFELSSALNKVGISMNLCKLYSKAMPYFEEAKRIRMTLPGFTPIVLYGINYNIAVSLLGQGSTAEAKSLLLQTLGEWEAVKGPNDKSSFRQVLVPVS